MSIKVNTGISEAEIIRQAIDRYAQSLHSPRRDLSAWERLRSRIGQLIAQGPVAGGRTWRREDWYEQGLSVDRTTVYRWVQLKRGCLRNDQPKKAHISLMLR